MAGRTYGRTVTKTKFSRKGGLPYFVTHGAPRALEGAQSSGDSRTRTTTSTRFSHRPTVNARKAASFWWEKRVTVIILARGFARISSC